MSLRRAGAGLLWLAILSALPAVAQQEPATWRQLYVEAGRSLAQGQYDQALKGYQAALDLTTEDNERAQVLLGLANVYRSRRDVPRQLDCLRQVEALPLLGDLPVIGNAFKNTSRTNNRTELLVFLTPRVVTDTAMAR